MEEKGKWRKKSVPLGATLFSTKYRLRGLQLQEGLPFSGISTANSDEVDMLPGVEEKESEDVSRNGKVRISVSEGRLGFMYCELTGEGRGNRARGIYAVFFN